MPKYLSLLLSPHISKTPEGYLICRDVLICRSGFQEYFGRELTRFPGYQTSWGLEPELRYKVLRPKEEVLDPETIASFNGKTVVNEHPDGDVVYLDNDGEVGCGHIQDVMRGPDLAPSEDDPEGAVTLKGDIHIKDPELVEKVWPAGNSDSGVRDISCGYSLRLKRLADGTLVMGKIRGNHVAVVEKGRAGELIAIKDAAPRVVTSSEPMLTAIGDSVPPEIKPRRTIMNIREMIFGRGLKVVMPDASSEEIAALMGDLEPKPAADPKKPVATDSLSKQDELAAEHPHRLAAHSALDRLLDARGSNDGMGKDAFGKPSNIDTLVKELLKFIQSEEAAAPADPAAPAVEEPAPAAAEAEPEPPADKEGDPEVEELAEAPKEEGAGEGDPDPDDEDEEDEPPVFGKSDKEEEEDDEDEEDEEEKKFGGAKDAEVDDKGDSVLKQANDSVRVFIQNSKPLVANIVAKPKAKRTPQEQTMVDSYNRAVRNVNAAGPGYTVLARVKVPKGIPALAVDAEEAENSAKAESDKIASFYEGVPWIKGKAAHDNYLKQKEGK